MSDLINSASITLREIIMDSLGKLVAEEAIPAVPLPSFNIEIPADKSHGDFAANTAMVCAKALRMPPRKIAELLCEKLDLEGTIFDRAEVAGPGFLNFFLSRKWFSDVVKNVLSEGENYGKTEFGKGKKVLVEFVSANPTGQIEKFGKSLELRYLQLCSDKGQELIAQYKDDTDKLCSVIYEGSGEGGEFEMPEDVYLGTDIIEHAKNFYDINGKSFAEASETDRRKALVDYALPINIEGLERDLKKYRIVYDNWFRESTVHEKNETKLVVDKLMEAGKAYEQDGAIWFKATEYGMDKDFVLKRSNGLYTYIVPDIAYHYNKLVTRNFDKAINVLGADHHGYVPRLKAALNALGVDETKLDVVLMQMVRLVRNGETVKLSKRSGKAITLVTLLDEIPIDAARFFFNLREANSQFEFDLGLAIEKTSQNPVYYVQYAHARICSMIRALAEEGINVPDSADFDLLSDAREIELIRHLASLPKEIDLAAKTYDPAKITKYAIDLATLFHRFYDACSVKNAENSDLRNARILLCVAVRQTLRNVLEILNIEKKKKM